MQDAWRSMRAGVVAPDAKYRELFENVPDAVYETSPEGRILAANPAMVRMLGFESEAQLMQSVTVDGVYADRGQRLAGLRELAAYGLVHNSELELIRADGMRITVLDNARAVRDASGSVVCYQGTLTDITARKEIERELRVARDQALEASRLKSHFLANISHELRTPLNAVLGMARLLADSPLDPAQKEYADTIVNSTHHLVDIIGELLDFSRIEAGRLELHNGIFRTREVAEEAAYLFAERSAARGIELICSIDPEVPELVWGDAPRLRQTLVNLIGNALKFTETGEVEVRVRAAAGGRVRFEVRDTGTGVVDDARPFIFEPFRQADGSAKRRYGGTGIGLTIVREIVTAMGGNVGFQSECGTGSLFWFEVPFAVAPGCGQAANRSSAVLTGKRALLLEPNQTAAALYRTWLQRWGVEVFERLPEVLSDGTAIDFVIATETILTGRTLADPAATLGVNSSALFYLLMPVEDRRAGAEAAPPWVTDTLRKPVRELALLDTLLRGSAPPLSDAAGSIQALARKLAPPRGSTRILAAEDNKVNQKVIRRLVERLGYFIDVVGDGYQLIEALHRSPYDLILMDCQMPGMDGFEATQAVRQLPAPLCDTPIIAVTAHAVQGDRELCHDAGMNDYISKPILLEELASAIDRWRVHSAIQAQRRPAHAAD